MPKYTFDYRNEFTITVCADNQKDAKELILIQDKDCIIEFGTFCIWPCFLVLAEDEENDIDEEQNDYRKE